MKTAVVGSRDFNDYEKLKTKLDSLTPPPTEIISGGAEGADTLAARWAKEHNIPVTVFIPDWNTYGKRAGALRNQQIVNAAERVVAFWNGKSPGTKITIDMTKRANKELIIIT